uniref:Uncharacterized protein n=1 Tax=Physarum polycephalum TaxID=5791 RepID=Q9MJ79_PHYPO|nr:hypothetical protein PhpooMp04 [Physarum polycephalum]BAB08083.1 unnamed protein product [Physarum polycephalum]
MILYQKIQHTNFFTNKISYSNFIRFYPGNLGKTQPKSIKEMPESKTPQEITKYFPSGTTLQDLEEVAQDVMYPKEMSSIPTEKSEEPIKSAAVKEEEKKIIEKLIEADTIAEKIQGNSHIFNPLRLVYNTSSKVWNYLKKNVEFKFHKPESDNYTVPITAVYDTKQGSSDIQYNLEKIIKDLKIAIQEKSLNKEQVKSIIDDIRKNYVTKGVSIENANELLTLWKSYDFQYEPLKQICKIKKDIIINKEQEKIVIDSKSSYEEKLKNLEEKMSIALKNINNFLEKNKDYTKEFLEAKELQEWYDYFQNRGALKKLSKQEKEVYDKLLEIKNKYLPSEKDFQEKNSSYLTPLKKNSALPINLQNEKSAKCYLPKDYVMEITNIERALEILNKSQTLSINDLKLLSINSSAVTIDTEGVIKISQEAYQSFTKYKDSLGFKYLLEYPKTEEILLRIKERNFFIAKNMDSNPNGIIALAHLSHNTLIIPNQTEKNLYVRVGLVTSTKSDSNIKIDSYQVTNEDSNKQNKDQMFRIFPTFLIVDEKIEPLIVNLEMTLYFYGKNTDNKSIVEEIIFTQYDLTKNIWSENYYQYPFNVDQEFLRQLSIIFYSNKLQELQQDYKELQDKLYSLLIKSHEDYNKEIDRLNELKTNYLKDRKYKQYFNSLTDEEQKLVSHIKIFQDKIKDDNIQNEKKQKKELINQLLEKNKKGKDKEEGTEILTAKQKKEKYLKDKQNINNIDEKNN